MTIEQWFQENSQYTDNSALGHYGWEDTLSLSRITEEGKSQSGWGRADFIRNYNKGRFRPRRILEEFEEGFPFGFIMRSIDEVCVDIDGKNGGIQASRILRLPPTLAETSKGGNGYHLFYTAPSAAWTEEFGFDLYPDANGIVPGVDVRSVGMIYHYPQQRWNTLDPVPLPNSLRRLLEQKSATIALDRERRQTELTGEDLAIAREQTLQRLAGPIPPGGRNQKLFALGSNLQLYKVSNWKDLIIARGDQLGLEMIEIKKLINHISRYSK